MTVQRKCPRLWTLGCHDGFHNRRGKATSNTPRTVPQHHPQCIHEATAPQHCNDGFHKTVVAGRLATRPPQCHDTIHDASTTFPHPDSITTVSTNRRFVVKNRPRHRRGKATSNTPKTVPRHPQRHFHATIVPRRFPETVILLSKTVHDTVVARRPVGRPRQCHDAIHNASTTLPRHDSVMTVFTNRRFVVKNRPQNRRGKATKNPPTTLLRHSHKGLTTVPRRFMETSFLLVGAGLLATNIMPTQTSPHASSHTNLQSNAQVRTKQIGV